MEKRGTVNDSRAKYLQNAPIVKMEPMFKPVRYWQLELFKTNDPRKMEHNSTTAFWAGQRKNIQAYDAKHKKPWERESEKS